MGEVVTLHKLVPRGGARARAGRTRMIEAIPGAGSATSGETATRLLAVMAADVGTRVPQMSSVKAPAISAMHNSMTNVRVRTPC